MQPSDDMGELESRQRGREENLSYKQVEPPTTDRGVGVALRKISRGCGEAEGLANIL